MARVVNFESSSTERNRKLQTISYAIRQLSQTPTNSGIAKDLSAYIVLELKEIDATVEKSAIAWEKRGYWVKADKFREEWSWVNRLSQNMRIALLVGDWDLVAQQVMKITETLGARKLPQRNKYGEIWIGAWDKLVK